MIHDLKPYPAYKDSGVPWLGKVPEHWVVRAFRTLASVQKGRAPARLHGPEKNSEGDLPYLSMEYLRSDNLEAQTFAETQRDLVVAKKSDLILLWDGSNAGEFLLAKTGVVSSTSSLIKSHTVNPRYFFYACKLGEPTIRAFTVGMGIPHVDGNTLKGISFSLPPINEQSAIVRYLDNTLRRIRRYIHAKQKLIKLLEEQKQAIIQQAVTRGLDLNVKLKPLGMEWLGDVPEDWDLLRLKDAVFQIVDTEHKTAPFYENGNYLVVRTSNVKNGQLSFSDAKYTDEAGFKEWTRRGIPEPGDILFTREAPAGEACLVPEGLPLCLGQRMVLFRVNPEVLDSQFGLYSIYGGAAAEFIRQLSLGSTVPHFNMFDIACIPMLLPPISEQKKIASFLNHESKKISEAIGHAYQKISLLREYRTRLIADVVTGKLDVREAGAKLPEETDETETFDDALDEDEELENNEIENEQAGELEEEVLV